MFDRDVTDKLDAINLTVEEALKQKLGCMQHVLQYATKEEGAVEEWLERITKVFERDILDKLDAVKIMAHEARLQHKLGDTPLSQLDACLETGVCASYDERTGEIIVDMVLPPMPKQANPLYPVGFPVEAPLQAVNIRPIKGLSGHLGPSGLPDPVYHTPSMPSLLRTTASKPLMYSVDVYRAVSHEGGYVAVSSFPITATINMTETKMKPCAFGTTPKEAEDKLAEAIKGLTGRREVGVINTHYMTERWLCVKCINSLGYPTKAELLEHMSLQHTDSGSLAT